MDEIEVINPRRRRKSSKRRTVRRATRRRRARRNPPHFMRTTSRGQRRRARNTVRGYYPNPHRRRHIRRNPVGNIMNSAMDVVKDGAIGVVGIGINNALGNTAADLLKVTDPNLRAATKVATAVLLPTLVGMVLPAFKRQAAVGGAAAIAHIGALYLETNVYPKLGTTVSSLLSSRGNGGFISPGPPSADEVKGYGYMPGNRSYVGYLPGVRSYLGVNRMPNPGMMNSF